MTEQQRRFDTAVPWLILATASLALLGLTTGGTLIIMGRNPLTSNVTWAIWRAIAGCVLFAAWPLIARRRQAERLLKTGVYVVLALTCLQFVAAHIIWADALRPPVTITLPDGTMVHSP